MDLNKLLLIGTVTRAAECRGSYDGRPAAYFVVGTKTEGLPPIQHTVCAYATPLFTIAMRLVKGQAVYVEASLLVGAILAKEIIVLNKKENNDE